ncbi:DUF4190 domain-containing protein [Glaciibacter psychrotolerans]|uniref:DUF4190 domain-containing protein n=1 Tax=Glaciibacter psychrotolerans TaxID=670054 RepID=A0A7Z0EI01_9MICO|nr:DUF4190 domain-containing protein [Leifsonia psychrotolerans]NYJ21595.1 hypothetical protein [Leifsonia psychrotolerans]
MTDPTLPNDAASAVPPTTPPISDAPTSEAPSAAPADAAPSAAPTYGAQPATPTYAAPPAYNAQPAPGAPAYGAAPTMQPGYAQPVPAAPAGSTYNVLAIISLVSAFFFNLVAIITGHIALSQIKRTGENGRGLAIAGVVIGYVSLAVSILVGALFIIGMIAAGSYSSTY